MPPIFAKEPPKFINLPINSTTNVSLGEFLPDGIDSCTSCKIYVDLKNAFLFTQYISKERVLVFRPEFTDLNKTSFDLKIKLKRSQTDVRSTIYFIKLNITKPLVKPNIPYVPPKPILVECTFKIENIERDGLMTLKILGKNFTSNLTEQLNPSRDLKLTLTTQDDQNIPFKFQSKNDTLGIVKLQMKFRYPSEISTGKVIK
jgi:hypothetical protein